MKLAWMDFLLYWSTLIQIIFIWLLFSGLAVVGLYTVRRLIGIERLKEHHQVSSVTFGVIGAFYGLLLAFVIVAAWQRYERAEESLESEALSLSELYRMADSLDEPTRSILKRATRSYTEQMLLQDLPAMADNSYRVNGNRSGTLVLWQILQNYKPADAHDSVVMDKCVDQLDTISDKRSMRNLFYNQSLPSVVWLVIWIGCVITVGFSFFFAVDSFAAQALMCGTLSGLLGITILAISELAHPYQGHAISDAPLTICLARMDDMDQLTAFGISAGATAAIVSTDHAFAKNTVRVGILHSLTGPMAISEVPVKNATLLAIEQINVAGGVMGRSIIPLIEDGASDPVTFAAMARKLIQDDKVATVFGGWTSASRKAMLPEFERLHSLLWYPLQFEGNECSPNIMYSGAQPNQQLLPALQWAFHKGYKRIFLLGSDYVFPRTANLILKTHIIAGRGEVAGEEYVPFDLRDFSDVVATIRAAKPQIIFNTITGMGNRYFFRAMAEAHTPPSKLPVMSFSIAEQESKAIGSKLLVGDYAAWNYFQSVDSAANRKLVAAYRAKFGSDSVVDDPMAHGYMDVYEWAAAAAKAKSFDIDAVRKAAPTLEWTDAGVGVAKFTVYQSLMQRAYIGELQADGQFKILWQSEGIPEGLIYPEPYDPLTFPGKVCLPF